MSVQLMVAAGQWHKGLLKALKGSETCWRDEVGTQALVVTLKVHNPMRGTDEFLTYVWGATEFDGLVLKSSSGATAAEVVHAGRLELVTKSIQPQKEEL